MTEGFPVTNLYRKFVADLSVLSGGVIAMEFDFHRNPSMIIRLLHCTGA
jgi:hypothetical protein